MQRGTWIKNLLNYSYFVFDCDGVILDSNTIKTNAFFFCLNQYPSKKVNNLIEYHKENGGISRYEKLNYFFRDVMGFEDYKLEYEKSLISFSSYLNEHMHQANYVAGVFSLLESLEQSKKKIYVSSGSDEDELKGLFKEKKISHFFEEILGSPQDKQNHLIKIMKKETGKGLFFGDSLTDFLASIQNNLDFVYVSKHSEWEPTKKDQKDFKFSIKDFLDLDIS